MLNFELMKHPLNWFIIWFMLLLAAFGGHYFLQFFNKEVTNDESER